MAVTNKALRTGELAHLAGVSPDTIRRYESAGILTTPPRTPSGYRMYGRDAVDRVLLVQRALHLGFRLKELSEVLRVRDGGGVPCHRVLNLAEEKLRTLEGQIEDLRQARRYLRQIVLQWKAKLRQTKPGGKAALLQSLVHKPLPSTKRLSNFGGRRQS